MRALFLVTLSLLITLNANAGAPVSGVCLRHTLDTMIVRYEERFNLSQEVRERKVAALANREIQEKAAFTNRQNRIETVLTRIKKSEPLLPSELREFKSAAEDLRNANRIDEALLVEKRIKIHEVKYAPKQGPTLTAEQEKLIAEKITLSPLAVKQIQELNTDVRQLIEKKLFLEIAEHPRTTGIFYKGGQTIDGIPSSNFKKLRFSANSKSAYRIIFRVNNDGTIVIEAVATRGSVYQGKFRAFGGSSG